MSEHQAEPTYADRMFDEPVDLGIADPDRAVSSVRFGTESYLTGGRGEGTTWYEGRGRVGDRAVWIEGRISDAINRGGLEVFPGEVEEVLRSAPGVSDAAVVSVPDGRLGEVPVAFVVAEAGATATAGLETLCREHLSPYEVPVAFRAVGALPTNEVGKVLRSELSRRACS